MKLSAYLGLVAVMAVIGGCSNGDGLPDTSSGYDAWEADGASEDGTTEKAEEAPNLFEKTWWEVGDESGLLELLETSALFKEREWLVLEASSWFDYIEHETPGEVPVDSSRLGYYGIGNGIVFAFTGTWYPLNTLHELLGPDYQKKDSDGYFSDFSVFPTEGGRIQRWTREWIWKPRKVQIALTRMQTANSPLEMDTIVFAPVSDAPGPERNCIVQVVNARNTGDEALDDVGITVQSFSPSTLVGNEAMEQERSGDVMRVRPLDLDGWALVEKTDDHDFPAFISPSFSLDPGKERQFVVVYEFAEQADPIGQGRDAVAAAGWGDLLDETAAWWKTWHESGLTITTPDQRVNDLIEGLKSTIMVEIAENGAASEMSHYTGSWHRDVFPPVRTMLKFGYMEEARGMADYLYGAAAVKGGIGNALDADMVIPDPVPDVDWMASVPFSHERLRGEGPSFLPLMNLLVWRYTGEAGAVLDKWDYLMHALRGQTVTDEGLMYFSGDETFRVVYALNIGLGLEWDFVHKAFSAYSAYLFVSACEMLAGFIEETGADKPEDLAWLKERAAFVREATDDLYWLDGDGRYASMIHMDGDIPEPIPSEDINTQPVWLGYHDRDDEPALENLLGTMDAILKDNGLLQTALGTEEELMGYAVGQGVQTGMTPGYFLFSGADVNLEVAEKTFDAVGMYVSRSGNYPEVGLFAEPGRALCPVYDETGGIGELWARYRHWEGAINLEALMHYLVGFEADVARGWLQVAPHLPHDAPFVEAENILFNGKTFSMRFAMEGEGFVMSLSGEGDPASYGLKEYRLRMTVPLSQIGIVEVDGKDLEQGKWQERGVAPGLIEVSLVVDAEENSVKVRVE